MKLGYNTNGFAHHRLEDTLRILADLGYGSVALTLDYHALNPFDAELPNQLVTIRRLLEQLKLSCVVETGARFLLNPWHKHQPTLLSREPEERGRRSAFLCRAVDIARELQADAVSFWSGTSAEHETDAVLWPRLIDGCRIVADYAARQEVRLAFEPEPGMFIDTMAKFQTLHQQVAHPAFGLTIDIGHLHCQGETPLADHLVRWRDWLWNIHLEDMRRGIHDHLFFGEGEIDFAPIFDTLRAIHYQFGVYVELSRHSHDAVRAARNAMAFLNPLSK